MNGNAVGTPAPNGRPAWLRWTVLGVAGLVLALLVFLAGVAVGRRQDTTVSAGGATTTVAVTTTRPASTTAAATTVAPTTQPATTTCPTCPTTTAAPATTVRPITTTRPTTTTQPATTTTTLPASCPGDPVGVATFETVDELQAALSGDWLLCGVHWYSAGEVPSTVYAQPGQVGLEFRYDGRFARLGGTASAPVALTGWDNEGDYELLDTSDMNSPGWYQLNLRLDPGTGTNICHPSLSADLQRLRLVDGMLGQFDYVRFSA